MPIYTVLDTLDHNGTRYEAGEEVDLAANTAKVLVALGVVGPKPKEKTPAKEDPKS